MSDCRSETVVIAVVKCCVIGGEVDEGGLKSLFMSTQIAITLPEKVFKQAQRLARLTHRPVDDLLAEAITLSLAPVATSAGSNPPVAELSDKQVLSLTKLEMPAAQDRRLSRLLNWQQAGKLAGEERAELVSLMQIYQERLLRKAQALNEAVRRGLVEPMAP